MSSTPSPVGVEDGAADARQARDEDPGCPDVDEGWFCTRPLDHEGDHAAWAGYGDGMLMHRWPNEKEV